MPLSPRAASTLTRWTYKAVTSCFCDKCARTFHSDLSVLQHFQASPRHLATVEALEVSGTVMKCLSTPPSQLI